MGRLDYVLPVLLFSCSPFLAAARRDLAHRRIGMGVLVALGCNTSNGHGSLFCSLLGDRLGLQGGSKRWHFKSLWKIGGKLTQRLALHGVQTVQDLRDAHVPTLRAEFGVVMEKIQRELQEIACIGMEEVQPDKQQIISSRSFGSMVTELPVLKDAVSTFAASACAKLRVQSSQAAVIQVFLQTNRFRKDLLQYNPSLAVPLPYPTNDSLEVNRWADYLCERMFKDG